jgi:hypothetical protein
MSAFSYPFEHLVSYDTDEDYREQLCRLVAASRPAPSGCGADQDIDARQYPDADMHEFIDSLLAVTEEIPAMRELYVRAAGVFMSTDIGIGLVSLFSYDHFAYFHACLCAVLRGAEPVTVEEYGVLLSRFDLRV